MFPDRRHAARKVQRYFKFLQGISISPPTNLINVILTFLIQAVKQMLLTGLFTTPAGRKIGSLTGKKDQSLNRGRPDGCHGLLNVTTTGLTGRKVRRKIADTMPAGFESEGKALVADFRAKLSGKPLFPKTQYDNCRFQ